jgi:hypothetical protein
MCTVLLPPGVNPTAVNKYIISYHKRELFSVMRDEDVSDGTKKEYSLNLHYIIVRKYRLVFLKWILEETKLLEYF